jgi:hypothetical protein
MLDLARYINFDLRPNAERVSGGQTLWRWEDYKREQWSGRSSPGRILALVLDKARWLVFIVASLVGLFAYWRLVGFGDHRYAVWAIGDAVLILISFGILLFAEETRGLKPPTA